MKLTQRRFALRERTATTHAALDAEVGALTSRAAYGRYLTGLAAFRGPIERDLATRPLPAGFGSWRPTRIDAAIAADARDLGIAPPDPGPCDASPATGSGLLGMLYVLEGSALGARILQRQAAGLGLDARFGARHLAVQTASPEAWRGFCAILEAWPDFDLDEAARSAAATFTRARRAFSDRAHAPG
jgi:heme oxygenase